MAVPGRKVRVRTAMVFMAALSWRVSSATCAVALASSMLSRLSRRDSSAILRELCAISMLSLLSRWMIKFVICACQYGHPFRQYRDDLTVLD